MKKGLYDYSTVNETEFENIILYLKKRIENDRLNIIDQMNILEFSGSKKLLDIGCGTGGVDEIFALNNLSGSIYAIDVEPRFIEEAARNLDASCKKQINFDVGDCYHLPYEDNEFDCCYSRLVFDHLAEPQKAIKEIQRVVKNNGKIGIYCRDELLTCYSPLPRHYYKVMSAYMSVLRFTGGSITRGRELNSFFVNAGLKNINVFKYIYDIYTPGRDILKDEFMISNGFIDNHILVKSKVLSSEIIREFYSDIKDILYRNDSYVALFDFFVTADNHKEELK